ncbi:MAG: urease accessory protein UreD, partial [Alistipes sp.]
TSLFPLPSTRVGSVSVFRDLRLGFELDASGRSILRDWERRAPLIVQQALYFDEQLPDLPCVYILSSGGPNVDGDRYEQHITVRRGASAHVSTGAATKLAAMRYNFSALRQTFRLEAGAYLEFLPEPTIPCRRTRFWSDTEFRVDPSATLFYSEIYLAGRRHHEGERFAYDLLSVASRAYGPDERLLFREKFVIRPAFRSPETRGAMGGYDVFANAVVLTPPACAEAIYAATECISDPQRQLATGILRLPDGCGLSFRVLGMDSGTVKQAVRDFCSTVRRTVKGRPLPPEFPWR